MLSAAAKASQNGSSREFQTLADLQHLRSFITGPVLLTMLDAPVTPVYLLVVFLVHPHLGFIVGGTGVVLLIVALLNQRVTANPFDAGQRLWHARQPAGRCHGAQRPGASMPWA